MLTLRELQAELRRALLEGTDGEPARALGAEILADGLDVEARLGIYRHHVLTTLTAVLRETFAVVARLVGDGFFAFAADAYVRREPPHGPCLAEYGAGFAGFLAAFPPCRDLVYLPDVARLEWAMHAAFHAEEASGLEIGRLRAIPAEAAAALVFRLDPSLALLASPWPVDRIWRANQPGADPDAIVDLGAGSVHLEIRRIGDDVVLATLPPAAHAFRATLLAAGTLGAAAEAALALDAAFDVAGALHGLFADGLVIGLEASS
jgi:hypothetical protein